MTVTTTQPTHLLLYTTSQTPLQPRYPYPSQPAVVIPPLLHTSLHSALDRQPPSWKLHRETVYIPDPADVPFAAIGNAVKASDNGSGSRFSNGNGLSSSAASLDDEVTEDDEVTLRFYLTSSASSPSADRVSTQLSHICAGVSLFLDHKKWKKIDTLLVGWRHVNYVGQPPVPSDDDSARPGGCGSMKLASKLKADAERVIGSSEEEWEDEERKEEMKQLWQQLPSVLPIEVGLIGTMSLPLPLLELLTDCSSPLSTSAPTPIRSTSPSVPDASHSSTVKDINAEPSATASFNDISSTSPVYATSEDRQLLAGLPSAHPPSVSAPSRGSRTHHAATGHTSRAPAVNRLNTPDCHSLPQDLLRFAKEHNIQLWAGGSGEGSDPLPAKHLHNTLAEFVPQFPPEFLPAGSQLGGIVPFEGEDADQPLGVDVDWVIAYTVVSRTRNVVRDKGYIISARLL